MQSLGERELPNLKKKGAGVKYTEGLYFLMDMDIRYVLCLKMIPISNFVLFQGE